MRYGLAVFEGIGPGCAAGCAGLIVYSLRCACRRGLEVLRVGVFRRVAVRYGLAVFEGISPGCAAGRAGLIVYSLRRAARRGPEVLRVGVLRRVTVRYGLTVFEGLCPSRSAGRAGLIVYRLRRACRRGLKVLHVGILLRIAVRCKLAVLLAAECADCFLGACGHAAGAIFGRGMARVACADAVMRTVAVRCPYVVMVKRGPTRGEGPARVIHIAAGAGPVIDRVILAVRCFYQR